ncbi:ribonuclease BN [Streptomyces sp. H27-H5]|uniref:ribonuclease BN n=1 Tax=Streptomyces sp. H27-H5 TaxID=2996460 RepID=UPI00226E06E0|nr:ribonuclease BN [Streptomyces sp. H27-H5]MCY0955356.1 ribonuclease BN [Streptomyces sp. H27-H5]
MFGLTGQADAQLQQVLGSSTGNNLRETTGVVGLLMALISATSFSRAMARVCERAWQLPKSRTRIAAWRWFAWLLALLLVVFMEGPIREGFGAGLWIGIPLTFLLGVGVGMWTQHLFLAGRIGWTALPPGAVLASIATTVLSLSATLYMPAALNRALNEYGSLGLVLTLLSWLIAICAAVTFALTIGAVLAQEPPLNRFLTTDRRSP